MDQLDLSTKLDPYLIILESQLIIVIIWYRSN